MRDLIKVREYEAVQGSVEAVVVEELEQLINRVIDRTWEIQDGDKYLSDLREELHDVLACLREKVVA